MKCVTDISMCVIYIFQCVCVCVCAWGVLNFFSVKLLSTKVLHFSHKHPSLQRNERANMFPHAANLSVHTLGFGYQKTLICSPRKMGK